MSKPDIAYDDFLKIDLRVGLVVSAESVPKSSKLLRLDVDLGELGHRTILAGIADTYAPMSLIGTNVVVVANLTPRKVMGIESHGMLLAAEVELEDDGKVLRLATAAADAGAELG